MSVIMGKLISSKIMYSISPKAAFFFFLLSQTLKNTIDSIGLYSASW